MSGGEASGLLPFFEPCEHFWESFIIGARCQHCGQIQWLPGEVLAGPPWERRGKDARTEPVRERIE